MSFLLKTPVEENLLRATYRNKQKASKYQQFCFLFSLLLDLNYVARPPYKIVLNEPLLQKH